MLSRLIKCTDLEVDHELIAQIRLPSCRETDLSHPLSVKDSFNTVGEDTHHRQYNFRLRVIRFRNCIGMTHDPLHFVLIRSLYVPLPPMPLTDVGGVGAWEPIRLTTVDLSNSLSLHRHRGRKEKSKWRPGRGQSSQSVKFNWVDEKWSENKRVTHIFPPAQKQQAGFQETSAPQGISWSHCPSCLAAHRRHDAGSDQQCWMMSNILDPSSRFGDCGIFEYPSSIRGLDT